MGQQITIDTKRIYYTYLMLGLLENEEDALSQKSILDELGIGNNYDRSIVRKKLVKYFTGWLADAELPNNIIEEIISASNVGFRLNSQIPNGPYKDFLGALLYLQMIEDKQHTNGLDELVDKEGEKPLSIITKLILAKKAGKSLNLQPKNETARFSFIPTQFSLEGNKWYISGKKRNGITEIKIALSDIFELQ